MTFRVGFLGAHVSARRIGVGLGLVELRIGLRNVGDIKIVSGLGGVVLLLGVDSVLEEGLGAIPIQLFLFQVGLRVLDICLSGFFRRDVSRNVGFRRSDCGLLAVDVGFLLHVLNGGDHLSLVDSVAFRHVEMGDAAHGIRAYVDVVLWA